MDKSTADWLRGQVAASHKYLQVCLLPLLKLHKVPRAEEDIAQALFALNRISSNLGDAGASHGKE
jgi:hypothetical protein